MKPLVVQKFGGATLATPGQVKAIAKRIQAESKTRSTVAVVSAMGTTTNSLIDLARQVSRRPQRRELDMLLTVGERTSMALLSMALHDLGVDAISFTGSQAGILTDDDHFNARIVDIRPFRVEDALKKGKVVILAGFQGVSESAKEITTLGRGGTDVTAVAMAAALKAERCEILKEVDGILTADPKIVPNARLCPTLDYGQLLDMTFWGAKVVHYRAAEIARKMNVPLFVGSCEKPTTPGTLVKGESMFEKHSFVSINSHEIVLEVSLGTGPREPALREFTRFLTEKEIAFPQILSWATSNSNTLRVTAPRETITALQTELADASSPFRLAAEPLSSVTVTSTGSMTEDDAGRILKLLDAAACETREWLFNPLGVTVFLPAGDRAKAIQSLHALIS